MIIQITLIIFAVFALSRVLLQLKQGNLTPYAFLFWTIIFTAGVLGVIFPETTVRLAKYLGIGRGVDVVIYFSIALLFYLVFRLYILLEDIRHEISEIVRRIALKK